jgi:dTDP-glucose 4,6-dehydratase
MILNAVEGKPLPVYGDGQQIRDWLYVEDHCRAIWSVIKNAPPGETYNIGGDNQPTNLEIVQEICRVLDERMPESNYIPHYNLVEHVKDRPGHDRRYAMDIRKIKADLGWEPLISLSEGIRKTAAWYLENQDWVKKIRNRGDYQSWMKSNYQQRESL